MPCDNNEKVLGFMSVKTNPAGNPSFVKVDKVYPGTTLTKDWKQLQPLPCPTGFAKASKKQLNQYIKRFLYDYITNQKLIGGVFKTNKFPYCDVGFTLLDIKPLSGCLAYQNRSNKDLMGSAVFKYQCFGSKATRTVGIVASGVYRLEKLWDVVIEFEA